jgi:hypothetical protein
MAGSETSVVKQMRRLRLGDVVPAAFFELMQIDLAERAPQLFSIQAALR